MHVEGEHNSPSARAKRNSKKRRSSATRTNISGEHSSHTSQTLTEDEQSSDSTSRAAQSSHQHSPTEGSHNAPWFKKKAPTVGSFLSSGSEDLLGGKTVQRMDEDGMGLGRTTRVGEDANVEDFVEDEDDSDEEDGAGNKQQGDAEKTEQEKHVEEEEADLEDILLASCEMSLSGIGPLGFKGETAMQIDRLRKKSLLEFLRMRNNKDFGGLIDDTMRGGDEYFFSIMPALTLQLFVEWDLKYPPIVELQQEEEQAEDKEHDGGSFETIPKHVSTKPEMFRVDNPDKVGFDLEPDDPERWDHHLGGFWVCEAEPPCFANDK